MKLEIYPSKAKVNGPFQLKCFPILHSLEIAVGCRLFPDERNDDLGVKCKDQSFTQRMKREKKNRWFCAGIKTELEVSKYHFKQKDFEVVH